MGFRLATVEVGCSVDRTSKFDWSTTLPSSSPTRMPFGALLPVSRFASNILLSYLVLYIIGLALGLGSVE